MKIAFLDLKATYLELKSELDDAYTRVMNSGYWIMGPELKAFEEEFAKYCGVKFCLGVADGLDALHLLLRVQGIGPGDEVIVPSNTYIASWLAVTHAGAKIVPVEPIPETHNIDPTKIENAITSNTKAIMPVHLYGQPAEMEPINKLAKKHNLLVLDDCAQGHGGRYQGKVVGSLCDASAFSFYPSKNLGAIGDGGAITTDNAETADKVRVIRNYGSRVRYFNEIIGYNSRLDELQAAFLRVKLKYVDEWNKRREVLANVYYQELEEVSEVILPSIPTDTKPVWHLFVVRVRNRDLIKDRLEQRGIQTIIHYPVPPHLSEAYLQNDGWKRGDLQIAEALANEVISLPLGPHMKVQDVKIVCEALKRALKSD